MTRSRAGALAALIGGLLLLSACGPKRPVLYPTPRPGRMPINAWPKPDNTV